MSEYKQTLGEYRVGISFNPSGNPLVDEIKRKAEDLIDLILDMPSDEGNAATIYHLQARAAERVEEAAMWAVKAATKPERE